jgi:hypothetical protein
MLVLTGKTVRHNDPASADFSFVALPGVRIEFSSRDEVLGETLSDALGNWTFYVPENSIIGIVYTLADYQVAASVITIYGTGSFSAGTMVLIAQSDVGTSGDDTLEFKFAENDEDGDNPPISGATVSIRFGGMVLRLDGDGKPVWRQYPTGIGLVYDHMQIMSSSITNTAGVVRFTGANKRAEGTFDIVFAANKYIPFAHQGTKTWNLRYNVSASTPYLVSRLPEYEATTYYAVFLYVTLDGATCPGQVFWLSCSASRYNKRVAADEGTDPTQSNIEFNDITVDGDYRLSYEIGASVYIPLRITDRDTGEVFENIDTLDGYLYSVMISGASRHINVEMVQFHTLSVPFLQDIESEDASDDDIPTGNIGPGVAYINDGYTTVTYNGEDYADQEKFVGVAEVTDYTTTGTGKVRVWEPATFERPIALEVVDDEDIVIPITASFSDDLDTPPTGLIATVRLPDGGYGIQAASSKFTGIQDVRS